MRFYVITENERMNFNNKIQAVKFAQNNGGVVVNENALHDFYDGNIMFHYTMGNLYDYAGLNIESILKNSNVYLKKSYDYNLENENLLIASDYITMLVKCLLRHLESKGNLTATDILTGKNNGLVTIEDLTNEMWLVLMENKGSWVAYTDGSKLFLDFYKEEVEKAFYRTVSKIMYSQKTKHDRKKLYIEIGNEEVAIDNVSKLASHVCIDDVMTLSDFNTFLSWLRQEKPKKAVLFEKFIYERLNGLTIKECAKVLNIKETTAFDCSKQLKVLWKKFHKDF